MHLQPRRRSARLPVGVRDALDLAYRVALGRSTVMRHHLASPKAECVHAVSVASPSLTCLLVPAAGLPQEIRRATIEQPGEQ